VNRLTRARLDPYVRAAQVDLAVLFGVLALYQIYQGWTVGLRAYAGWDFTHYVDAARRWLEAGSPYLASEISDRFQFTDLTFLHPPIALYLFAPFLVLPAILYWLIPIAGTGAVIALWRPARWTWPLMAFLLNWPRFVGAMVVGNTDLWVVFFIALGLRFGWPVLLLAIKPSIAPFALVELAALIRVDAVPVRRWSEIALAAALLVLAAVPFGGLWLSWLSVIRNSPADPLYSIGALPWLIVPAVAWIGRRRGRRRSDIHRGVTPRREDRRASREREGDRDKQRAKDKAQIGVRRDRERGDDRDVAPDLEHRRDEEHEPEDVE
jgi:hypothetical protein